ncbi:outer membrane beta-barrel domain-containing protein [Alteromonas sp. McT4-15]|uniref:outer membrane beta-barrel domain-containing protein n=1 Tax=Alteromonas sp. McT4-15 TaxID=2881256 RepID=UPI001CF8E85E|nr:outer membrane beta-barrel domain-containing protein [Alteromonas sp. McT4-15]MCB4434840.1 outer membrane beta-barrel domain-containing protein [Alteromonas sp. McT4-15]MEC8232403.1 outer membrane beta-barrel domain-containing protein [Pseudomonadota bacterium]
MDVRSIRLLLMSFTALVVSVGAVAQQGPIIEPNLERRDIREADIDSENVEIGVFAGQVSIEDFSSSSIVGVSLGYHITENIFVEATYAQADAGETSFEILSGGAPFLTEEEREYRYYDLSVGYNFNGELFVTQNTVFNTDFFVTVGGGSTDFGGESQFTLSLGAGYRVLITDYFALRLDVRDRIFNSEIIGEEKDTHNIQYTLGATYFF